ncbi:MAG: HutD family protein [Dokdonella sp.]|nr:HutD family protein [Dokdonella sp.]
MPPPAIGPLADFRWRVSIAEIECDGPFSTFPGIDRDLVLLAGNGMELDIDEASPLRMDRRLQAVRFAGEQAVQCRLLAGPTRDLNVMVRRGEVSAEVAARPLTGSMLLFREPGVCWFVHVLAGHATLQMDGTSIEATLNDSLILEPTAAHARGVLTGAGELVLVKLIDNASGSKPL